MDKKHTFDKTVENMKKGNSVLGKETFFVSMTVSLYNFFTICDDALFWCEKDLVNTIGFNYVYGSHYTFKFKLKQKLIDKVLAPV